MQFKKSLFLTALLLLLHTPVHAVTCDPQGWASVIGDEYIVDRCMPEGSNDNTSHHYHVTTLECVSGQVVRKVLSTDWATNQTPAEIVNTGRMMQFRVFRNTDGSQILMMPKYYKGIVDGIDMENYAEAQVHTEVFSQGFILPSPAPTCKLENTPCQDNTPSHSTVQLGTGALNHSQELFSLNGLIHLPISVSLFYNSLDDYSSPSGPNWSHSYSLSVQDTGSMVIFRKDGKKRTYTLSGGAYIPQKWDYSTLAKTAGTYTITERDGTRYEFDSSGKATSIKDKYNNTLTLTYTSGRLTSVSDQGGRTITFAYYPDGTLNTITDPNSKAYTFIYAGGRLATVRHPETLGEWTYTYHPNGQLMTKTDPNGNIATYNYYTDKKIQNAAMTGAGTKEYSYPVAATETGKVPDAYPNAVIMHQESVLTDENTGNLKHTYNKDGSLKSRTDQYGKLISYTYYPDGSMKSRTEPYDGSTKYTTFYKYDAYGNLLAVTDPVDLTTLSPTINPETVADPISDTRLKVAARYIYDYANFDRILSISDERVTPALTTTYVYTTETGLEVTTITDPEGKVTRQYRNPDGSINRITDGNNATTTLDYYPNGLLNTITGVNGTKTTITIYDANGNPEEIKVTDKTGRDITTQTNINDSMNRIKEVTTTAASLPVITTKYGYDPNGNTNSIIDPENKETKYEHTYKGQIKKIIDADLKETSLTYGGTSCGSCGGGSDKLTSIKDANLHETTYNYDLAGRVERETDPLGKIIRYTYYDNGLVKQKIDATDSLNEKTLITHEYNNRGQITKKTLSDGTQTTYTYHPDGTLQTATNQQISYTYQWYKNGWPKSATDTAGKKITYDQYDGIGQKKQITVYHGAIPYTTITYDYDTASRPWKINFTDNITTKTIETGYDDMGRRKTIKYPNSITATYNYDDLSRLTSITHKDPNGSSISETAYTQYDNAGNKKARTENGINSTYQYDNIYRLADANHTSATLNYHEYYQYDPVGNRTTSQTSSSYTHNEANQLTNTAMGTYTYDNTGNLTQKTEGTTTNTYTYSSDNKLTHVTRNTDGSITEISYSYDPFDRRIGKTITTGTTTKTINYLHDNEDIIIQYENSNPRITWIHGPGIDEPLAGMDTATSTYKTYYLHADGQGSILKITDSNRIVVQDYKYDSYGNIYATSILQPYTYTGREYDAETGLYYYRARYYDPKIGRFVQKDPIGFEGGDVNLYSYVGNNPVNRIDPMGLEWIYSQSTGQLNHYVLNGNNTFVGTGYSGHGEGLNNPIMQYVPNTGTIPQGTYNIGQQQTNVTNSGTVLPGSMRLTPQPGTNTLNNRGGFLIHGGNFSTRSSSTGCIVAPPDIRNQIGNSGDTTLRVLP